MSVVIIIGGERLRAALSDLETASLNMTQEQRDAAESAVADAATALKNLADGGGDAPLGG